VPGRELCVEAGGGLGLREARDVALRGFSGSYGFVDFHTKYLKRNAYLRQELASAG
jgi:hypothetical protein